MAVAASSGLANSTKAMPDGRPSALMTILTLQVIPKLLAPKMPSLLCNVPLQNLLQVSSLMACRHGTPSSEN